ncbi:MAG: pyrimidine reductase family protein [Jatrophihabitantaceae bacterium]
MRALLPEPDRDITSDVDLHEFYANGWVDGGGLRINFVSSVDGAATAEGVSGGLQTPGDNKVFGVLRDLADVIVVGAGTARTEAYKPSKPGAARRAIRRSHGFAEYPPIAVVSRSLRLDPTAALFTSTDPAARTIVITCEAGDPAVRTALEPIADVLVLGEHDVDLAAARAALIERGLTRILSEGGPTLFGDLARAGQVDELCLSLSPLLSGPGARRIIAGQMWPGSTARLTLTGLLEEDDALFCRYRVAPPN